MCLAKEEEVLQDSYMKKITAIFCFFLSSFVTYAFNTLPTLKLNRDSITVSGLSSGAYMAVQLQVIHSEIFKGVGTFAGGIFGCAEGDVNKATKLCMKNPNEIDTEKYIEFTDKLKELGKVGELENLVGKPAYIFNGNRDSVVRMESAYRLKEFFDHYKLNTTINTNISSEHGVPTLSQGSKCGKKGEPWIQNCGYDGAGELLTHLYGKLHPPTSFNNTLINLENFNQKEFATITNLLFDEGYVYIPSGCRMGENPHCRLHIAFHGCVQGPEYAQDIFPKTAGYNTWAEANNIVVLYPSAKTGGLNMKGCWDWFGYTGLTYLTKDGEQIKAIMKMVDRLTL